MVVDKVKYSVCPHPFMRLRDARQVRDQTRRARQYETTTSDDAYQSNVVKCDFDFCLIYMKVPK